MPTESSTALVKKTLGDLTVPEKVTAAIIPLTITAAVATGLYFILPPLIMIFSWMWVALGLGIPLFMIGSFLWFSRETVSSWWLGKIEQMNYDIIKSDPILVGRGTIYKLNAGLRRVVQNLQRLAAGETELVSEIERMQEEMRDCMRQAARFKNVPEAASDFANAMSQARRLEESIADTTKDLERIRYFIKIGGLAERSAKAKIENIKNAINVLAQRLRTSRITREALAGALEMGETATYQLAEQSIRAARENLSADLGVIGAMVSRSEGTLRGQALNERMDISEAQEMFSRWEKGEPLSQPTLASGQPPIAALQPVSDGLGISSSLQKLLDSNHSGSAVTVDREHQK